MEKEENKKRQFRPLTSMKRAHVATEATAGLRLLQQDEGTLLKKVQPPRCLHRREGLLSET
jgi:hypothetical protein